MNGRRRKRALCLLLVAMLLYLNVAESLKRSEKRQLKRKVVQMFDHAYKAYMDNAYPADELMPLSCRGRHRGTEPSRGDIDDALGNFSLTLVDTLDTLAVMGKIKAFDQAIKLVIKDVSLNNDIVVSVFETNIRMLGGLLGGHVMAVYLKKSGKGVPWYNNELLDMAKNLGYRLLPAFNTTTGIPYPRVNLMHGLDKDISRTGSEKDTCTACAGTILLEFAALSRMTGDTVFEDKAHRVMEFLWQQRHRTSDLVGTVINIHNGDWVRRESGIGAGIDSYYEYLLKGYILLGDESYLDRFNIHYTAIKKYVNQGPMLVDVHMHRPNTASRNFMDSLGAFWPGLQVLKGDIKSAIETHEMLYQVMTRHHFLPEAFTTDFRVHWGQHPLRPEFVESTYFLYKATGDPYYLQVGKKVIENLERYARVPCGYAAIKDVTTMVQEDQMDSFVMSETFKYLYLLFSEHEDLLVDVDDYVFTTEAHLLPLTLAMHNYSYNYTMQVELSWTSDYEGLDTRGERACPNNNNLYPSNIGRYAQKIRHPLKHLVENSCPKPKLTAKMRLRPAEFVAGNKVQLEILKEMGIRLATMNDGRVQLLHTASDAKSPEEAEAGLVFMQEMIQFSKSQQQEVQQEPRVVQLLSEPYKGSVSISAGPAQFGLNLRGIKGIRGTVVTANPMHACTDLENQHEIKGKIVLMKRGNCMFVDKARQIESKGAVGGIVIDNHEGTTTKMSPLFAMSGDGNNNVNIPMVFLFSEEGRQLETYIEELGGIEVMLADKPIPTDQDIESYFKMESDHLIMSDTEEQTKKTYTYKDAFYEYQTKSATVTKQGKLKQVAGGNYLVFQNNEIELTVTTQIDTTPTTTVTTTTTSTKDVKILQGPDGSVKLSFTFVVPISTNEERNSEVSKQLYNQMLEMFVRKTNLISLNDQGQYWMTIVFLTEGIFIFGHLNKLNGNYRKAYDNMVDELRLTDNEPDDAFVEAKCKEYSVERLGSGGIMLARQVGNQMHLFSQEPLAAEKKTLESYVTDLELLGFNSKGVSRTIKDEEGLNIQLDQDGQHFKILEGSKIELDLQDAIIKWKETIDQSESTKNEEHRDIYSQDDNKKIEDIQIQDHIQSAFKEKSDTLNGRVLDKNIPTQSRQSIDKENTAYSLLSEDSDSSTDNERTKNNQKDEL